MAYKFKFKLLDVVFIIELERPGKVVEINIDTGGIQYRVRYFDDGQAKFVYFFSDELELRKKKIIQDILKLKGKTEK